MLKTQIYDKYSGYLKNYITLPVEEKSKHPALVQTKEYTHCVLVCKCASPKRAIRKFCRAFRYYNPGMLIWNVIMLDNLYHGRLKMARRDSGGYYSFEVEPIEGGYYSVYLRVSGNYNGFALVEREEGNHAADSRRII